MPELYKSIKDGEHMKNRETHEALVELSWDAIAAFMPITHSTGPTADSSKRLQAVAASAGFQENRNEQVEDAGYYLDVGCGNGLLLPFLKKEGIPAASYVGCDVSSRMIELAEKEYLSTNAIFISDSFENVVSGSTTAEKKVYDGIVFNGSIQFFPDITQTLRTAADNLSKGGRIVLSHINGGAFVSKEMQDNPTTVRTLMPKISDLKDIAKTLDLELTLPSFARTDGKGGVEGADMKLEDFYLVVLKKSTNGIHDGNMISEYINFPEIKL
mmetsp:Transcript_33177/g.40145  ORF Transcript_33177/g.40145 Transcript_33177/m.40145 type:complete len:271 (-) Transcript_33177:164-976(-)